MFFGVSASAQIRILSEKTILSVQIDRNTWLLKQDKFYSLKTDEFELPIGQYPELYLHEFIQIISNKDTVKTKEATYVGSYNSILVMKKHEHFFFSKKAIKKALKFVEDGF